MNIKQTVFIAVLFSSIFSVFISPVTLADCAGVKTSIINCEQSGSCEDGTNAFEGEDPGDDQKKIDAYTNTITGYGHEYGKCANGATPSSNVEDSGVWGILMLAINIMTAGVSVLAVGGVIYGSVLYASAGGNSEQTKKAMEIIKNVVIGIIVYAFMFSLLNFIIPGGLFS